MTNLNRIQKNKHDYKPDRSAPKILASLVAVNTIISFDFVSLQFDLTEHGKEAHFHMDRYAFMRSTNPRVKPTDPAESHLAPLYGSEEAKTKYPNAHLTEAEKLKVKKHVLKEKILKPYDLYKTIYPNCKLYIDKIPSRLGNIWIYIENAKLQVRFSGKITANENSLGYITRDNISETLDIIKDTGLIWFNNDVFIEHARVLRCDIVADIYTESPNTLIKAFSSYLPLRTDKYAVIGFASGYEVIQRMKKGEYELAIYHKGKEINTQGTDAYKRTIGKQCIEWSQKVVRLELRLFKFTAQRLFLMDTPETVEENEEIVEGEADTEEAKSDEAGEETKKPTNLTLQELLNVDKQPIIHMLDLLAINPKVLQKARGKYLASTDPVKEMKVAEYQRMLGCLYLVEKNDYDLDKVRSHIEVELGKPLPAGYLADIRERLQDYIACFKPRAVMTLQRLLEELRY